MRSFEPEMQASQLKACFYCGGKLPATRKEHVFNSCWGGSHKTSRLICDDCNSAFSAIDDALSPYVSLVMNAWEFKGERHRSVPTLATGGRYTIHSGGVPKLTAPKVSTADLVDGQGVIHIQANSKSDVRRMLRDGTLEASIGRTLSEEQRQALLDQIRNTVPTRLDEETIPITLTIAPDNEYRSATHTLLKCLGLYVPNAVLDPCMDQVKRFARFGEGAWDRFAVRARPLVSVAKGAEHVLGVRQNSVDIYACGHTGRIVGVLSILNRLTRSIRLTDDYTGPTLMLSVIEHAYGTGKLTAHCVEFDRDFSCLSLVTVEDGPPTIDSLSKEIVDLARTTLLFDAPLARFSKSFAKLFESHEFLTEQSIEICTGLLLDLVVRILGGLRIEVTDRRVISQQLEAAGLGRAKATFMGRRLDDKELHRMMSTALIETIEHFRRLGGASTV